MTTLDIIKPDTADRIRRLVAEHLAVGYEDAGEAADIQDDLGADSLDVIDLIHACEDEFGIEIPDADIEEIDTVGDLIAYVVRTAA